MTHCGSANEILGERPLWGKGEVGSEVELGGSKTRNCAGSVEGSGGIPPKDGYAKESLLAKGDISHPTQELAWPNQTPFWPFLEPTLVPKKHPSLGTEE